jgi:hypothetical protein
MVIFILPQQFEWNSQGREGRHMGQENVDKLLDFNSTLKTNDPLENILDGVVQLLRSYQARSYCYRGRYRKEAG